MEPIWRYLHAIWIQIAPHEKKRGDYYPRKLTLETGIVGGFFTPPEKAA